MDSVRAGLRLLSENFRSLSRSWRSQQPRRVFLQFVPKSSRPMINPILRYVWSSASKEQAKSVLALAFGLRVPFPTTPPRLKPSFAPGMVELVCWHPGHGRQLKGVIMRTQQDPWGPFSFFRDDVFDCMSHAFGLLNFDIPTRMQ